MQAAADPASDSLALTSGEFVLLGEHRLKPRRVRRRCEMHNANTLSVLSTKPNLPMATQSYAAIQAQIAELASKAQALKVEESAAVVARIREDIATYGLTVQDIFGRKGAGPKIKFGSRLKPGAGSIGRAKYSNGMGGVYGGRGPHPRWLREALAAGKKLESFLVGAGQPEAAAESSETAAPAKKAAAKKGTAKKSTVANKSAK